MASCNRCGRLNLPKGRDGRRTCRSCGPKPSIEDRFVANRLGCRLVVGLAEYGETIGLSFAAHIAAQSFALTETNVVSSFQPRLKARTGWMEDAR